MVCEGPSNDEREEQADSLFLPHNAEDRERIWSQNFRCNQSSSGQRTKSHHVSSSEEIIGCIKVVWENGGKVKQGEEKLN